MKKIFTTVFLCSILLSVKSQSVVISQVYGAGNNSGAVYQNDFVELFNASSVPVDIGGWSIQYANATNATGNWGVNVIPAFTLNPGQYFLMQLSGGTANGIALPTPDATGTTNMGGTAGRVALVNSSTQLPAGCPASSSAYVDLIGYGTATCFEGSGPTPAPSTANAIFRGNNGCTDVQNNASDFTAAPPAPRNSASPLNVCGAPLPYISVSPGSINTNSNFGSASAIQTVTVQAANLSPASGSITVTPSANVEVSLSSGGPFITAPAFLTLSYTGGTLSSAAFYVRINASASQGAFSGTVTLAGGTATDAIVNINGGVYQNFYNTKANLGLHDFGSWSSTLNGGGASPVAFSDPYQLFNIVNAANTDYTGVLDISNAGNTTRLIVGDGVNPITFMVKPNVDSLTSATRVDVLNNATLNIDNRRRPFLNTIADGSTVEYSLTQTTSIDTIRITSSVQYYNLKLTKGIKFLPTGTTTVRGDLTVDGVASIGGSATSVSKVNVFGDVNFLNGAAFDNGPNADIVKFSIGFNGSSGTQALNANGTELKLFRIQRDTTTSPCVINVGANSTMTLGGPSGGGLLLNQSGSNTTTLSTGSNTINFISGGAMSASATGKLSTTNGTVNVLKSAGTGDGGSLRFASGSTLAGLTINLDPAITRDTVTIGDSVTVQSLTLTKGKVVVRSSAVLEVANGGTITGGTSNSYVDGKLKRSSTQSLFYPVGKGTKYAPVSLTTKGSLNVYTVQYFNSTYSSLTIDPATKATFPNYRVSTNEYWVVDQGAGSPSTVDLTLSYDLASQVNTPAAARIAHFDGTDWNDLGATVLEPGSNASSGNITATNVSTFSPFTFAATADGIIPIRLEYVKAQKAGSGNTINWKLTCLSTSVTMEILRSADSRNFTALNSITATQERCGQPFDYNDVQPLQGKNYYRLKMTDADGKVSYSPVVVVINGNKGFEFAGLYPTYVKSETALSVSSVKAAVVETKITDMSGRIVKSFVSSVPAGSSLLKIDCSALASGIYNVTSVADKATSATARFVKY